MPKWNEFESFKKHQTKEHHQLEITYEGKHQSINQRTNQSIKEYETKLITKLLTNN